MRKKVVRYGLISTSQIGINAHLPASLESKNSEKKGTDLFSNVIEYVSEEFF